MSIAIIIPTLNEADGIEQCLTALQPLRRQQCQIIVADGGSSDATQRLAEPLADRVIDAPKGRARQMNAGAEIATCDRLLFLHADTYLPTTALAEIDAGFASEKPWGRFDIKLSGQSLLLSIIAWMISQRSRLSGVATGDQAIFVDRRVFEQVGQYPDIALMEDIALCQRLKKLSRPYCSKAKVTSSSRRWQENGIIKTIVLMWWLRAGYYFGIAPDTLAQLYYRGTFWKH